MKKVKNIPEDDDMLPEYDFRGKKGVRGKYYRAMQQGYTVRKKSLQKTAARK